MLKGNISIVLNTDIHGKVEVYDEMSKQRFYQTMEMIKVIIVTRNFI
jgi:hypothetical protein